jgi:hypothetical protein
MLHRWTLGSDASSPDGNNCMPELESWPSKGDDPSAQETHTRPPGGSGGGGSAVDRQNASDIAADLAHYRTVIATMESRDTGATVTEQDLDRLIVGILGPRPHDKGGGPAWRQAMNDESLRTTQLFRLEPTWDAHRDRAPAAASVGNFTAALRVKHKWAGAPPKGPGDAHKTRMCITDAGHNPGWKPKPDQAEMH